MKAARIATVCLPLIFFLAGQMFAIERAQGPKKTYECYETGQVYRSVSMDGKSGLQFEPVQVTPGREGDVESSVYYFDPLTGSRGEKLLEFSTNMLQSVQWDGRRVLLYGPGNFEFSDERALANRKIEPIIVFQELPEIPQLPVASRGYYFVNLKCEIFCTIWRAISRPC